MREINNKLDHAVQDAQRKLEQTNPEIVQEQKSLIIDLKTRVNILEKELTLVSAQTAKEIDDLRRDKEALTGNLIGVNGDQEKSRHQEQINMGKVHKILEESKKELEAASVQIGQLKQELTIQ